MTIEFEGKISSGRLWIPKEIQKKHAIEDGDIFRCTLTKLVLKEAKR